MAFSGFSSSFSPLAEFGLSEFVAPAFLYCVKRLWSKKDFLSDA
jgi:hypothetical protein